MVSGIHRDADGFHPSRRLDGERETRGNERETGVGCCAVYAHFPASLCLLFSSSFLPFSPSFIHSPQSFALFLFLLYPLYPFSILLFLLNSPLVFSLPLQFRVICAYIRPLYHFLSFSLLSSTKEFIFSQKKKERKQRDQGRKKQNSMTLAISKWQLNYHIFRYLRSNLALILQESIRKNGKKNSSDSSHSFLPQWHLIHDRKNCGVVCASRKGGEGFRLINR